MSFQADTSFELVMARQQGTSHGCNKRTNSYYKTKPHDISRSSCHVQISIR